MNPDSLTARLGWTLVHFLWQGSLIALAHAVVVALLKRHSAQARYLAGCLALMAIALAPAVTFAVQPAGVVMRAAPNFPPLPKLSPGTGAAAPAAAPHDATKADTFLELLSRKSEAVLPWLVTAWGVGVALLSARLAGGWIQTQRLKTRQTWPIGEPLMSRLEPLKERLAITRPVRLLMSRLVEVPTLIGWLRPVILFPASALTGLSPAQLESILAHELAHIRRHDYLVNFLQRILEAALFYHPAVWWISNAVREERELCCDEMAVCVCGDRVGYARALAAMEELRAGSLEFALGAADGSLLERVRRLLGKTTEGSSAPRRRILWSLLALAVVIAIVSTGPFGGKWYEATARIQIWESPEDSTQAARAMAQGGGHDPYFIQTEFEKLRSKVVLSRVIESLHLDKQFSQRAGSPEPLKRVEVYDQLMKRIEIRQVPNTRLIDIQAWSEDPREAAEIANGIVRAYRDAQEERMHAGASHSQAILIRQLAEVRPKVFQSEDNLAKLRRELGTSVADVGEIHATAVETERVFERQKAETEIKLAKSQTTLDQFKTLPKASLAEAIHHSPYPSARLSELLSQLNLAEQNQISLLEEYGDKHPKTVACRMLVAKLREQSDHMANAILGSIQSEVNQYRAEIDSLPRWIEESRLKEANLIEKLHPYFEAKREHEAVKRTYETVNLRVIQEGIEAQLVKGPGLEIINPAEPPTRATRRWF